MGIYIYTIRATKPITVEVPGVGKVKANRMAYAYKDSSLPWFDAQERARMEFRRNNFHRHAIDLFARGVSGYAFVCDPTDDPEGCGLYAELEKPVWWDTDKFPAKKAVGILRKRGRIYVVDSVGPWQEGWNTCINNETIPLRVRTKVAENRFFEERQYKLPDGSWKSL